MQYLLPRRAVALVLAGILIAALPSVPGIRAADAQSVDERPNVLVIVTDDQRDTMQMLPKTRDLFGREGRSYPSAYVTTPLCCPSRSSIMTGRYVHNHGVTSNDIVQSLPFEDSLQATLQRRGYTTALFGKFLNAWPMSKTPPHFDTFAVSEHGYRDRRWNTDGAVGVVPGYNTDIIGDRAVNFLEEQHSKPDPWLMYVAPYGPHAPYDTDHAYRRAALPGFKPNPAMSETDRTDKPPYIQEHLQSYDLGGDRVRRGQLRTMPPIDDLVARVFAELRRLGEENTIAVFISDNGKLWGEHGYIGKRVPYTEAVKVPFYVRWPGHVAAGSVDTRLVANIDITPTILGALGLDPGVRDGRNLLDESWTRDRLLLEVPSGASWASTRTSAYQFIRSYNPDGALVFEEYYDLAADPWQLENLLADDNPANDPEVEALRSQLADDMTCVGADSAAENPCP